MRMLLLSVVLVGLGVGGGYVLGTRRAQQPAPATAGDAGRGDAGRGAARSDAERGAIVVAGGGLSEADLRRVVQEELAARDRGAAGAAEAAPAAARPGNPVAFDAGMLRVNQAIVQRRWTRDDAAALGRALDTTSPEQRATILHTLIPALNRGEIKLTYRGDLF